MALTLPGAAASRAPAGACETASQLNAWLKIARDNSITIIVDRSEMGQGVYTALPMLMAEELNIDLDAIQIVAAPVGDAYISPGNGGQITGTSNSVQESWDKLRMAGATARTMLIAAAAQRWRVEPAQCHAKNGTVVNARGAVLTYGELADAAAKLPMPKDVKLKPKIDFEIIGKSRPRTDTPGKVDGSAEFGFDVKLPGMLHAALAQSPVLGGKVQAARFRRRRENARRAQGADHRERRGRRCRSFLAGLEGPQGLGHHVGPGCRTRTRQRRHPRAAEEDRRGRRRPVGAHRRQCGGGAQIGGADA